LKHLPTLTITWTKSVPIKVDLRDVTYTTKELLKILNEESDCNYHIFLNSVTTIRSVVNKLNTSDYKIVCSQKSASNIKTMKVGSTVDPPNKYNFYTAAAFEGCDIFDPYGKTIILCDTSIATTILDISTLIRQISGRVRDTIYKEQITIILNTNKHRYVGVTPDMFRLKVQENANLGKYTEKMFNEVNDGKYQTKELRSYHPDTFHSFYVNMYDKKLFYDDNLRKVDEYNYKLIAEIYKCSISVITEIVDCGMVIAEKTDWITPKLQNREYTFQELGEIFENDFTIKGLEFTPKTMKDYFPDFEKTRKIRNKQRDTYYKFKID